MQPSPSCAASTFIAVDERADAAGHMLGERGRGVVARRQEQPVEQGLGRHVLAKRQHADLRAGRIDGLLGDQYRGVGSRGADHAQRGHQLREAGHVQALQRIELPQHATVAQVEQQACAWRVAEARLHRIARAAEVKRQRSFAERQSERVSASGSPARPLASAPRAVVPARLTCARSCAPCPSAPAASETARGAERRATSTKRPARASRSATPVP